MKNYTHLKILYQVARQQQWERYDTFDNITECEGTIICKYFVWKVIMLNIVATEKNLRHRYVWVDAKLGNGVEWDGKIQLSFQLRVWD